MRPKVAARLITLDPDNLTSIDEVVAVASGAGNQRAVRAALSGGLVHSLVCDSTPAEALLGS